MFIKLLKLKYAIYALFSRKRKIAIIAWLPNFNLFKIKQNNWGDDVSLVLVRLITNNTVIPAQFRFSATKKKNYSVVGSLLPWYIYDTTIVWGSGVKAPDIPFIRKPTQVLAVRGPLTRKILLENSIPCPEVYGDPALLFPLYYNEQQEIKYDVGIVLHHSDLEDKNSIETVNLLKRKHNILLINIKEYGKWRSFIDKVRSCRYIISSSLHGLIIADAYGVPNSWGKFTYDFGSGRFKFYDYFMSVNREVEEPILIDETTDVNALLNSLDNNIKPTINIEGLINSCPFENSIYPRYLEYINNNQDSMFSNE